jgi:RNA polymerase sigma factor (TIGR02999 family)
MTNVSTPSPTSPDKSTRKSHGGGGGSDTLLLPLVYQELRRLAAHKMAAEAPGHTLQATALVHEAWIRLRGEGHDWKSRAQYFAAAAEAMRRILIDSARRKAAERHGGKLERVDSDAVDLEIESPAPSEKLLELNDALDQLAEHDVRKAELVKLRYFAGLTIDEAAEVLGVSAPTAKRDWAYAKAWLFRHIQTEANRDAT